jgi:hypothetical protein
MTVYSWLQEVERANGFFPRVDGSLAKPWKKVVCVNHTRKLAYWEARNQTVGD